MMTGSWGTFVISWSQTEVDGVRFAEPDLLTTGVSWRWSGRAVRVDAPDGPMPLDGAEGVGELRARAARMVRRLIGAALAPQGADGMPGRPGAAADPVAAETGFDLTDGRRLYAATLFDLPEAGSRLVMFAGSLPPADTDLWVVAARLARTSADRGGPAGGPGGPGGVICFTPGTRLATPAGPRPIETLRPGDLLLTRDSGPQPVLWTGHRRMSGARLHVLPHLRPIRLRGDALGLGRPEDDLIVSPHHRMLVRGPAARALFGTPEVLVRAADLVNGRSVIVDRSLREVTYVHVLLPAHQVIWANGLESESFHPAQTPLDLIEPGQRAQLTAVLPDLARDPAAYGDPVRRNLTAPEAALLAHDLAA